VEKMKFLEKARSVHGYKYRYINLSDKIKTSDKIQLEYNGSFFTQTVSKHLMGKCPEKRVDKKTTSDFIKSAKNVWGEKYDYSLVEYNGSLNNVKIIYDDVVYEQRASSHLDGMAPEFRKTEDSIIRDIIRENESIGESEISRFLDTYKLGYNIKHNMDGVEFDFYLPKIRTCIEFDGIQHFQIIKEFGEDLFNKNKINDKIKDDYCEDNFINLIRIGYHQVDDIYRILWDNLKEHIKVKKTN
jgi:very-short-patch-repair endonuclease